VTGLGASAYSIYGAGVDTQTMKEVVEKYSFTGSIQTGPFFMLELGISFHDIAFHDNMIWYALGSGGENSVEVYNSSGSLIHWIPSSIVPGAYGLTFDDAGYLWASDTNTDELYKISVDFTALERETWGAIKATVGSL